MAISIWHWTYVTVSEMCVYVNIICHTHFTTCFILYIKCQFYFILRLFDLAGSPYRIHYKDSTQVMLFDLAGFPLIYS